MSFTVANDIRLYYETVGDGPPLLLISGLNGGTWSWYDQAPRFARHYRTITFDNRGGGRSGQPPGPYTTEQLAADALGLLDHLEVATALVLGISLGGMIAQELALAAPSRVRALVLAATHGGGAARIPPPPEIIAVLMNNQGLSAEEIIRKDLPYFFSPGFRQRCPRQLEAYIAAQRTAPLQPEAAFAAQLAAARSFDAAARLPHLRLPALVLTGTGDVIVPPANTGRLAQLLPQARIGLFPGAGHAVHVECAAGFHNAVHDFFQNLPGAGA